MIDSIEDSVTPIAYKYASTLVMFEPGIKYDTR